VFTVKALPEFTAWLDQLADASIRGVVVARIKRLERGLLGDVEAVGEGVSELRKEKATMTARIKVDELSAFDASPYLDSEEAIAAYLTDILQANDAGLLSAALGDIARARGMTEIAKAAGLTREALYKALRPGSAPRFDTVNRVCVALGVRLVVQPLQAT
jgi:probable addiction module antidote protein